MRSFAAQPRVITGGVPVAINTSTAGTIAEMLAAADLMARGAVVYFPLVRNATCDLIALYRDGTLERIEVRCGHRKGGSVVYNAPDRSKSDRRAIVITGEPVSYVPPLVPSGATLVVLAEP